MAHETSFEIPSRSLGRADVKFVVKRDGKVFGTLTVSKGSVVWFPHKTSYGYKMAWSGFDKIMKQQATRVEKR